MKNILLMFLVTLTTLISGCKGFEIIDAGHRGVKVNLGKVEEETLGEGIHFCMPFVCSVKEMEVRTQKWSGETSAYTKDVQVANVKFAITYRPQADIMWRIYQNYGRDYAGKLLNQSVYGKIKDVIGQYDAVNLIANRDAAAGTAAEHIRKVMADAGVIVEKLEFTDLDYNKVFEKAVEDKVIAQQRAIEEKNRTVQKGEEAAQIRLLADADAHAMQVKAKALEQNPRLIEFERIGMLREKWNGSVPTIMMGGGGAIPLLNMNMKELTNSQ